MRGQMSALSALPLVLGLASGFLPGSGGVESAVAPVHAVIRTRPDPMDAQQTPAILHVHRGSRLGLLSQTARCAQPRATARPRRPKAAPAPSAVARPRSSSRRAPLPDRAPPAPLS
jgi:hypothetical protein